MTTDGTDPGPGEQALSALLTLLDVQPSGVDHFIGFPAQDALKQLFGGHVMAQAAMAASHTVSPDRQPHSLHAYFERPGRRDTPISYTVSRDRDGRSISTRRIVATQDDVPILVMTASFQGPDGGLCHQAVTMPSVPPPDDLEDDRAFYRRNLHIIPPESHGYFLRNRPIDVRIVPDDPAQPDLQCFWMRAAGVLPRDQALHRALLAYASDMKLLGATLRPHQIAYVSKHIKGGTINHSLWFHEDAAFDQWHLYCQRSPWAGHGRGLASGAIFSADGRLVVSATQEGLIRLTGA